MAATPRNGATASNVATATTTATAVVGSWRGAMVAAAPDSSCNGEQAQRCSAPPAAAAVVRLQRQQYVSSDTDDGGGGGCPTATSQLRDPRHQHRQSSTTSNTQSRTSNPAPIQCQSSSNRDNPAPASIQQQQSSSDKWSVSRRCVSPTTVHVRNRQPAGPAPPHSGNARQWGNTFWVYPCHGARRRPCVTASGRLVRSSRSR